MKKELVSILIPVYNRDNLIEETVQSALNQTYKDIEIIIVDNKSTDNTWQVLEELAVQDNRIKIFQNETNIGPVRNWQRCIDEATGKYGKILWSDDLIAPEFLEKTVPYLEDEDVGFVFTGIEIFDDTRNKKFSTCFIGSTDFYDSDYYIKNVLERGNFPVSPGCAIFRLNDLKNNLLINVPNKLNVDFSMQAIGNDLLIFLLTANQYPKFVFVNAKLSFFRVHQGSISTIEVEKLSLLYALSKAYFIEICSRKEMLPIYNSYLYLLLLKHRRNNLGITSIDLFYHKNSNFTFSIFQLIKLIFQKAYLKLLYKIKKFFRF